jgi:hypothetical protein
VRPFFFMSLQANYYLDLQGEQSEDVDRGLAARHARGVRLENLEWSYDALQAQEECRQGDMT